MNIYFFPSPSLINYHRVAAVGKGIALFCATAFFMAKNGNNLTAQATEMYITALLEERRCSQCVLTMGGWCNRLRPHSRVKISSDSLIFCSRPLHFKYIDVGTALKKVSCLL